MLIRFQFLINFLSLASTTGIIVQTRQGFIQGTYRVARNGVTFNAFFGIPYAQPPIGALRFQPPEPAGPWFDILYANTSSPSCAQIDRLTQTILGQEDCLYLNIFTPLTAKPGDNIPVMVFIHGGAYSDGNNERELPDYIMGYSVIIIQINYRLGVFGFLSTGDTVISGNFALKDQSMALKWTQENVYDFGGDPMRVTLAGHSSGADNVHLHTYSPLSHGLFQRIIILSGSGLSVISFYHPEIAASACHFVAEKVGCYQNSSQEILDCLLTVDAETLLTATSKLKVHRVQIAPILRPVIEDKNVENAFINDFPGVIRHQSMTVPWLIGHTTSEGATMAARSITWGKEALDVLNYEYEASWPIFTGHLWTARPEYFDYITNIYRSRYLANQNIGEETIQQLTRMLSDIYFDGPIYQAVASYSGPRYVYLYEYRSNFSTQIAVSGYKHFVGVSHVDDLQILFRRNESYNALTPQDIVFGDEILRRWVNFMYSGNPNTPYPIDTNIFGYWSPVVSDRIEYMRLNLNGYMDTDYDRTGYDLLNSLPLFSNFFLYDNYLFDYK